VEDLNLWLIDLRNCFVFTLKFVPSFTKMVFRRADALAFRCLDSRSYITAIDLLDRNKGQMLVRSDE
jgi:hypothetical protein